MASVTDPSFRIVFCEGEPASLDAILLNRVLPIAKNQIRPLGGKYGMNAFIRGYISSYDPIQPLFLGFRDRDFDAEPPETQQLIPLRGELPIWLTYRACIESYFLDVELLHAYWMQNSGAPAWHLGVPPTLDILRSTLVDAAKELGEYQATRWALAKLKPGDRWPEIRTTWTKGSGHLPLGLSFDECMLQAHALLGNFQTAIREITPANLQNTADEFRRRFADDDFYTQGQFLTWFHGKDLLVQWSRHLPTGFSRGHFTSWAADNLNPGHHPDLTQLATMCG